MSPLSARERRNIDFKGFQVQDLGSEQQIKLSDEIQLTHNKKVKVTFQFLYNPEVIGDNAYMIINENNLKAHGRITKVYCDKDTKFKEFKNQKKGKRKNSVPNKIIAGFGEEESKIEEEKSFKDRTKNPNVPPQTQHFIKEEE